MEQYLAIGKIVNTHGVKGDIKVLPLTDDINRFKKLKSVFIDIGGNLKEFSVSYAKTFNNMAVIKLNEIDTMDEAEKIKNCYLKIDRKDAIKLPKNSFFISDLIGIDVHSVEGEYLGKIIDVLQPGSNDVYVVKNGDKELLIPALKDVVKEVDIEANTMTVSLLEGLKDL